MKKVLLSTIILTAFALSIILFQISCRKTADAQSPQYILPVATTSRLGGVIPDGKTITVDGEGKISAPSTIIGSLFPVATTSALGGVIPDGLTILVNAAGKISAPLPIATASKLGGVIPDGTTITVNSNGKISAYAQVQQQNKILYIDNDSEDLTFWIANYDGTNAQKISVAYPTGLQPGFDKKLTLSPDHKTVFFELEQSSGTTDYIYACNIDGTNLHVVLSSNTIAPNVMAAY